MDLAVTQDPFVGRTLQGRYRVLRKLGEGGMGAVYAGEHALIKRPVALKVLLPAYAQNAEVVARFLQEATVVTQLRHEHIVDVTDMGQLEDGSLFMVLELLEGRDFAGLLEKEGPQSLGRVAHIVSQMCDALEVAHPAIVHRDLKPENVFLVTRKNDPYFVKILDFGISKIVGGDETSRAKTKTGVTIGTVYYMSPEQAQGKRSVDHRTDIYAIGAILYRALTGRFPFEGENVTNILLQIMMEPIPSIRAIRPDLPPEVETIVRRCMAKEPEGRYQTVADLRSALEPFIRSGLDRAPIVVRGDASAHEAADAATMNAPSAPQLGPAATLPASTAAAIDASAIRPVRWQPWAIGAVVLGLVGAAALAVSSGGSAAPASVRIESTPPGATATLDGRPLAGRTPITVTDGIASGTQYALALDLDGYAPWRGTVVAADGEIVQRATLAPQPSVVAEPELPRGELPPPETAAPATVVEASHRPHRPSETPPATVAAPPATRVEVASVHETPPPSVAAVPPPPPTSAAPAPSGIGELGHGRVRHIP